MEGSWRRGAVVRSTKERYRKVIQTINNVGEVAQVLVVGGYEHHHQNTLCLPLIMCPSLMVRPSLMVCPPLMGYLARARGHRIPSLVHHPTLVCLQSIISAQQPTFSAPRSTTQKGRVNEKLHYEARIRSDVAVVPKEIKDSVTFRAVRKINKG